MTVVAYPASGLFRAETNDNKPLSGGLLYTYASGTTTPIVTYQDSGGTIPNTNPVVLNFRGEAPVFLLFNVGYKLDLTDSLGNEIPGYPIDNIYNPILTTLYGGVDTGSVNAYVLNYTANFTSLTDGVIIYWTASNTNTGASTLNVNGLGVISVIQQNGSPLVAGMIGANTVIEVIYIAGQFILIASAYSTPLSGNFQMGITGFNPALSAITVTYTVINNVVTLTIPYFSGTSNNTGFTLTGLLPTLQPATVTSVVSIEPMQDNSVTILTSLATIAPGVSSIVLSQSAGTPTWTASGTKGNGETINRPFPLPPQIVNTTISWPLT